MAIHTRAVARAAAGKFLIADLPFLSFRKGIPAAMKAVGALVTSGAQAVKLEGVDGHEDVIRHIVGSGVPVMGHIGLTPQAVNQFGGFRVQGRTEDDAAKLLRQAHALEGLGCFSIVLECVPAELAARITSELAIPDDRHRSRHRHRWTDPRAARRLGTRHEPRPTFRPPLHRWRARPDRCAERIQRRRQGDAISRARRRATRDDGVREPVHLAPRASSADTRQD